MTDDFKCVQNLRYSGVWRDFLIYFFAFFILMGAVSSKEWVLIDEIFDFQGEAWELYCVVGRWGLAFYREIFGVGALPWSAVIFSGLYCAASLVIQTQLFAIRSIVAKCIFAILSLCSVVLMSFASFLHHADALCFSMLLSTFSVWLLIVKGPYWLGRTLLAVLCLGFALGIYQVMSIYFGSLLFIFVLREYLLEGKLVNWRHVCYVASVSALACALWYAVKEWTLSWDLNPAQRAMGEGYQSSITGLETFKQADILGKFNYLMAKIRTMVAFTLGLKHGSTWFHATIVIPLCYYLYILWRKQGFLLRVQGLICLVGIAFIPYSMSLVVMDVYGAALRTQLAAPLALAAMWAMLWQELERRRFILPFFRYALLVLLFIYAARTSYSTTRLHQNNTLITQKLIARLGSLESIRQDMSREQSRELKMRFIHAIQVGNTPLTYGTYGELAVHFEFWHMKNWDLDVPVPKYAQDMPIFPDYGSVRQYDDDTIVVKVPIPLYDERSKRNRKAIFEMLY